MAAKNMSEQDKRDLESFGRMAEGMEARRRELLAEAHRRAEIELHQYRMTVLNKLEGLTKIYSVSQIVRTTGIARSTIYRWLERLRQERIVSEAASRGIQLEGLGGIGGFGASPVSEGGQLLMPSAEPEPEKKSFEELGWCNIKRIASGEIGATDGSGDVWLFDNEDGSAWNKTQNAQVNERKNWPEGAEEMVDSLKQ